MKNSILLVDDDVDMRMALKEYLQPTYSVTEAGNGRAARDLLAQRNFDLVISDIQMPHLTGIELAEWIEAHKPTPTVLMTAYTRFGDLPQGCNLLRKPFDRHEFLKLIERHFPKPSEPQVDLDSQFCKISIEQFLADAGTDLNIYVRLSPYKYVRIAHPGSMFSPEQIKAYRSRNVHYIYIKKEDFSRLLTFNLTLAKAVSASDRVSAVKKAAFIKNASHFVMENAAVNGVNRESFESAADFVECVVDVVGSHTEMDELLSLFREQGDWLYTHSLAVATFSYMIGKAMGIQSLATLGKLVTGGLFHDIGLKEIDPDLLKKPRHLMTHTDRHVYESHAVRGRDILAAIKMIPSDIIDIAYQHHEHDSGDGYPRQVFKMRIHPLAKIIHIADVFCEYAIPGADGIEALPTVEALRRIASEKERFSPTAFMALFTIFDPPFPHENKQVSR